MPHGDVGSKEEIEKIVDMRLVEVSSRQNMGQGSGQVQEPLKEGDYSLMFRVRLTGQPPSQDEWRSEAEIGEAGGMALHAWVHYVRARMLLPLRGDCNIITGGPPCQSVSGNNRNALSDSILHDPRNRQLMVYIRLIEALKPNFVLLEQVLDVLLKENGVYVKTMTANLVRMGYQAHTGNLVTGAYGCPQGRARVIMLAARATEPLPPFPEPTHLVRQFNRTQAVDSAQCSVGFTCEAAVARAHDPVLVADAISDLPATSNFHSNDVGLYGAPPETPYQVFMRRAPPPWAADRGDRAAVGDAFIQPILAHLNSIWTQEMVHDGLAETGRRSGVMCVGSKNAIHARGSLPSPARRHVLTALHAHLVRQRSPSESATKRGAAPRRAAAAGGNGRPKDATETKAQFRARTADERRRNVLRRAFGLVSLQQRRDLRAALLQRLADARAVREEGGRRTDRLPVDGGAGTAPVPVSSEVLPRSTLEGIFGDGAGDEDRMSEDSTSSEASACSEADSEVEAATWEAGKAAKAVLWGRARGEVPVDKAPAPTKPDLRRDENAALNGKFADAANDGSGDASGTPDASEEGKRYAGEIERIRRQAQLSDAEAVAAASWQLAAGDAPAIDGLRVRDIPHRAPADPEAADLFARLHESEPDGGSDSDTDIDLYGGDEDAVQHSDPEDVVLVSQGTVAASGSSVSGGDSDAMDLTGTDTDDSAAAPRGVSGGAAHVPRASDAAAGMGLGVTQVDGAEALHGEGRPTAAADSRAEARAEAADRVRDALRNGRTAVQDVGEYSDEEALEESLHLQHRLAAGSPTAPDKAPSPAPLAAAPSGKRPAAETASMCTADGRAGSSKRMRGAGHGMAEDAGVLTDAPPQSCRHAGSGSAGEGAGGTPLTDAGAAGGAAEDAPVAVAPVVVAKAPSGGGAAARGSAPAQLMRLAARGGALGRTLAAAARATAGGHASDSGSDCQSDGGDAMATETADGGRSDLPATMHATEGGAGVAQRGTGRRGMHGAERGERQKSACASDAGPSEAASDSDIWQADSDSDSGRSDDDRADRIGVCADAGDLDGFLDPSARMYGILGATEALAAHDDVLAAVDEAAADLPVLRATRSAVEEPQHSPPASPSSCHAQAGLKQSQKREWVEYGLRVLAQYEAEAEQWQAGRAGARWRRALAEPPSDDWDRKVFAETVGGLTHEKSRLLFLMMFVTCRHQRYTQAGLCQLATVADYYASATESKARGGVVPAPDADAPYYPVGVVAQSVLEDRHEPSAKPRVARTLAGRAALYFHRHTKPGQRLQLVDTGRARVPLPLELLQPWRPGQAPWHGWQLAAAREAFSAGAREVRAHMPHACNIEDEMRMAAVPRYENRYLALLNHNFRDWPGVTINGDGSQCCGHFHAYIKREHGGLHSGCPSFNPDADMQLAGLYTMPQNTRNHDSRVDTNLRGMVTVTTQTASCPSRTVLLSTGRLLCPRYAATFKVGLASGHQGCFGRVPPLALMPTVVTRPEPHNLCIVHPTQDRVLTPRENARFQGFPDYYFIVSTGSIAKGESCIDQLEALAPCKPLPEQVKMSMWQEHEEAKEGGARGCRLVQTRFRNFNANRYLQTGNAVSPVLSAAIGRSIIAACSGETHVHSPVHAVPDLEWEAAVTVARERGLLSTYQELSLWAEAFQRQQALGHAARGLLPGPTDTAPPPPARPSAAPSATCTDLQQTDVAAGGPGECGGAAEHKSPSFEVAQATVKARRELERAMRSGEAPDGSEAHARLLQAARPPLREADVAAACTMHVQSQDLPPREAAAIVDVLEDHADALLTSELQHMQQAADAAGARAAALALADDHAAAGVGERWSDAGSDDDWCTAHVTRAPHACGSRSEDTSCVPFDVVGQRVSRVHAAHDSAGSDGHTEVAQENVPPVDAALAGSASQMAQLASRVKGTCIADASPNALLVERAGGKTVAALCDAPALVMGKAPHSGSDGDPCARPTATWPRNGEAAAAVEEIRSMVTLQPAAAGCALRQPPSQLLRAAGRRVRELPQGSVDVQRAWAGGGSAHAFRRRQPVLAHLSTEQAKRAHAMLQEAAPPEALLQALSQSTAEAAEGRRRLRENVSDGGNCAN